MLLEAFDELKARLFIRDWIIYEIKDIQTSLSGGNLSLTLDYPYFDSKRLTIASMAYVSFAPCSLATFL